MSAHASDLYPRFARQILLAEVGEQGQRAIGRAEARVGGTSFAHEVATLYASGAGFAEIVPGEIVDEAPASIVTDPAARAVLAGARAALSEIRRALREREGS